MTSTLFDDLGERLDAIAGAHTDHLELRHPNELPVGGHNDDRPNRLVWLAAAAVLIAVAAVWIGLRDGADLETEEPAVDPDAPAVTTELTLADLPGVFSRQPLPVDDPDVVAKAPWWDPATVRSVTFDQGTLHLASPSADLSRICIDVRLDGADTFAIGEEGVCGSLTGYLAGFPLVVLPLPDPAFVAGVLPLGTTGMDIGGDHPVQLLDGVYFAEIDGPGLLLEPIGGYDDQPSGTISGLLNGVEFDGDLTVAACISTADTWWVTGRSTDFTFRFGPGNGGVGPAFDSSTYTGTILDSYVLTSQDTAQGVRLTVDFDQDDTNGTAVIDCRYTLDGDEFSAGWAGN